MLHTRVQLSPSIVWHINMFVCRFSNSFFLFVVRRLVALLGLTGFFFLLVALLPCGRHFPRWTFGKGATSLNEHRNKSAVFLFFRLYFCREFYNCRIYVPSPFTRSKWPQIYCIRVNGKTVCALLWRDLANGDFDTMRMRRTLFLIMVWCGWAVRSQISGIIDYTICYYIRAQVFFRCLKATDSIVLVSLGIFESRKFRWRPNYLIYVSQFTIRHTRVRNKWFHDLSFHLFSVFIFSLNGQVKIQQK